MVMTDVPYTKEIKKYSVLVQDLIRLGCCPRCVLRALHVGEQWCYRKSGEEIQREIDECLSSMPTPSSTLDILSSLGSASTVSTKPSPNTETTNTAAQTLEENNEYENHNESERRKRKIGETDVTDSEDAKNVKQLKSDIEDCPCVLCLGILQDADKSVVNVTERILKEGYEDIVNMKVQVSLPAAVLVRQAAMIAYIQKTHSTIPGYLRSLSALDTIGVKDAVRYIYNPIISTSLGGIPQAVDRDEGMLRIGVNFEHEETASECEFLISVASAGLKASQRIKIGRVSRMKDKREKKESTGWIEPTAVAGFGNVRTAISNVKNEDFVRSAIEVNQVPPKQPLTKAGPPTLTITAESVFVAGRYNKLSRELSQTPWLIGGKLKTPHSVQSRMEAHYLAAAQCSSIGFTSSGREDADVRMLGEGRPFVIECINPKIRFSDPSKLCSLQRAVNESCQDVKVHDLQTVTKEDTQNNRDGEEFKRKTYVATVWFAEPQTEETIKELNSNGEFVIQQETPIRVLHRRPLLTRPRTVYDINLKLTDAHNGQLTLATQAGTYIKEFCHGDLGRTNPNLSHFLKCECDILALDVSAIQMDWPPRIPREY
eukprot:CFRG4628T1